jgi:hypothetical protein
MKTATAFALFFIIVFSSLAQDRLKPGAIYQQGAEIFAPMVGYRGIVPDDWFGTLPQEEEVFLMIPNGNEAGYMFINAHNVPLSRLKDDWLLDFSVTDEIIISIKGQPTIEGNRMWADFDVTGSREPFVGYAVAIEGGYGWTIGMILLAPTSQYEHYKKNFDQLLESSQIEAPRIGSIYGDFNWPEFLRNKYLMSYISSTQYKEQDEIWLCADGTFRSKIKSKGALVVEKSPYKGKRKGTWTAEGIGETGKLNLSASKGESVSLSMEIKDDKIFINGGRFFALESNDCK